MRQLTFKGSINFGSAGLQDTHNHANDDDDGDDDEFDDEEDDGFSTSKSAFDTG